MPWCDECAKYFAPNALTPAGDCPKCGAEIFFSDIHGRPLDKLVTAKFLDLKELARSAGEPEKAPWHFKLLVGVLCLYLTWRVIAIFL